MRIPNDNRNKIREMENSKRHLLSVVKKQELKMGGANVFDLLLQLLWERMWKVNFGIQCERK